MDFGLTVLAGATFSLQDNKQHSAKLESKLSCTFDTGHQVRMGCGQGIIHQNIWTGWSNLNVRNGKTNSGLESRENSDLP